MQLVEVKITSTVVTAPYGTLMPGTILRTSTAYAKHLVEEASAAKYLTNAEPVSLKQEEQQVTDPKRARKSKEIQQ